MYNPKKTISLQIVKGGTSVSSSSHMCTTTIFFSMLFSPEVINLLKAKSGLALNIPRDCERLSDLIKESTGRRISKSTLKRLLGFYSDQHAPMTYTLDAIANYLGFASWNMMEEELALQASDFGIMEGQIEASHIEPGTQVKVSYRPSREILFTYLGQEQFRVDAVSNSQKLQVGDVLIIQRFVQGYPLFATDVIRQGEHLGSYSSARTSGLLSIEITQS